MITLKKKLKKGMKNGNGDPLKRASIRDQLLVKEVVEMEKALPSTCEVSFHNPNLLHEFELIVAPDEGFWVGGHFQFHIYVTEEYNMVPPLVKCETRLWHPNISEDGAVCLSLLRRSSYDGLGWAPTRRLKDVVWGINALFTDLLNFEDPLNMEAAEMFLRDAPSFRNKVNLYVSEYAQR